MRSTLSICVALCLCIVFNGVLGAPSAQELFRNKEEEQQVSYDGAQLWRVDLDDKRAQELLTDLYNSEDGETSVWSLNATSADLFLKRSAIENIRQQFTNQNIRYSVLINNVQTEIDAGNQKPPNDPGYQNRSEKKLRRQMRQSTEGTLVYDEVGSVSDKNDVDDKNGHRLTWTAYHRTNDIYGFLEALVRTYPHLCRLLTIGTTAENRPLRVLRVSNGRANRAIWVDGGIHAREWISPASVTYIINNLVTNWNNQPAYIQNINWYFQPLVNPDGYEFSHTSNRLWRKNRVAAGNCRGVDLNRNYGHRWGGQGTSNNPCSDIYRGPAAFSERETQAHRQFFNTVGVRFSAFLTFHSYGQYILYPWGYAAELPPDHQQLQQLGLRAAQEIQRQGQQPYRVGSSAILLYPAAGGSDDWAKSIGVRFAYTVELRDNGRHGFLLPPNLIVPAATDALVFARVLAYYVATTARDDGQESIGEKF